MPLFNSNTQLFISGPVPSSGNAGLFISGPVPSSGNAGLFISGPVPFSGNVGLFIGSNFQSSGNTDLFTYNDKYAQSFPAEDSETDLYLTGANLASGDFPLFISGQGDAGTESNYSPLYLQSDTIESEQSSFIGLFASGNNDSNVPINSDSSTSLFLRNSITEDNNMPLYIEKVVDAYAPLYVDSRIASADISLYASGILSSSSDVDLVIKSPEGSGLTLYVSGYIE